MILVLNYHQLSLGCVPERKGIIIIALVIIPNELGNQTTWLFGVMPRALAIARLPINTH